MDTMIGCWINIRENRRDNKKIYNPEKPATYGTQNEDKQNKNTMQYVLGTTIFKQIQIRSIRHESSYRQPEVQTNRSSFLCGNRNGHYNTEWYTNVYKNVCWLSYLDVFGYLALRDILLFGFPMVIYWQIVADEWTINTVRVFLQPHTHSLAVIICLYGKTSDIIYSMYALSPFVHVEIFKILVFIKY